MSKTDLEIQYDHIQEQIDSLPKGYLSKKKINGKDRIYRQWNGNGKKYSKYVPNEEISLVSKEIELRSQLEDLLSLISSYSLETSLSKKKSSPKKKHGISYFSGNDLKGLIQDYRGYKHRFVFKELKRFLYDTNTLDKKRVLILYGLRRTGKTTLIMQALLNMKEGDFQKSVFIELNSFSEMGDLYELLKDLKEKGYRYIFLDEVTDMKDFIDGSAFIANLFASENMRVILSGTDSLGFIFSKEDSLYDRSYFLHTSFIPFQDFSNVLGINDIDAYIEYGGSMSLSGKIYSQRNSLSKASPYVDAAIADNIQHSLAYYKDGSYFRDLYELYERKELKNIINRVVEDSNHRFALEVLNQDFIYHDLGISCNNLRKESKEKYHILDKIDRNKVEDALKLSLGILNKEERTISIQEIHRKEIEDYLQELEIVRKIDVFSENSSRERNVVTIAGLRYSQAKELILNLRKDKTFQMIEPQTKDYVIQRILNEIKGRMLEDIILLETSLANPSLQVGKFIFHSGEFDMAIIYSDHSEIFEIKHSKERNKEQTKNLIDPEKRSLFEKRFPPIQRKAVLYRGETTKEGDIEYVNVEEYLNSISFDDYFSLDPH